MYYINKIDTLKDIFNTEEIELKDHTLGVKDHNYAIVNDVIILLDPSQYPPSLKKSLNTTVEDSLTKCDNFDKDIQYTFGKEWEKFPEIFPEHQQEFYQYFDLVDLTGLEDSRVCDLGCGIGRWSYFLHQKCREMILIDFSEAIFVARENLAHADNIIFFMGDLQRLPFRNDFCDFLFSLGVLHHLPISALDAIRFLKKYSNRLLIYLYYALDNRPFYFRVFFYVVNFIRNLVSKIKNPLFRTFFSWFIGLFLYEPMILVGKALSPFGLSKHVPLYEIYHGKKLERIRQDVYDRFFTPIEQRFSQKEILNLKSEFSSIIISEQIPYWHFLCYR